MHVLSVLLALLLVAVTGGSSRITGGLGAITKIPAPIPGLMGVSAASVTMAGAVKEQFKGVRPLC